MGISKWFARRGNVGGTARWAALGYKAMRQQMDGASLDDIMLAMVRIRYAVGADPGGRLGNEIGARISDGQISGLWLLVVTILELEAGFYENTPSNQGMFMEIIEEELRKADIPDKVIFDPDKSLAALKRSLRR